MVLVHTEAVVVIVVGGGRGGGQVEATEAETAAIRAATAVLAEGVVETETAAVAVVVGLCCRSSSRLGTKVNYRGPVAAAAAAGTATVTTATATAAPALPTWAGQLTMTYLSTGELMAGRLTSFFSLPTVVRGEEGEVRFFTNCPQTVTPGRLQQSSQTVHMKQSCTT